MADSRSGRNPATNSGSDSKKHYTGPASHQYSETPATPKSEVVTGTHVNGYVGNNGKPPKADERSAVK